MKGHVLYALMPGTPHRTHTMLSMPMSGMSSSFLYTSHAQIMHATAVHARAKNSIHIYIWIKGNVPTAAMVSKQTSFCGSAVAGEFNY